MLGLLVAFAFGYLVRYIQAGDLEKLFESLGLSGPMVLRRYDFKPPVQVVPMSHLQQWEMWTHRAVTFFEIVAREVGEPRGFLPSYTALERVSGLSRSVFKPYYKVLSEGNVIVTMNRSGSYWNMGKEARRKALGRLPYPTTKRPPRFDFTSVPKSQKSRASQVTGMTVAEPEYRHPVLRDKRSSPGHGASRSRE